MCLRTPAAPPEHLRAHLITCRPHPYTHAAPNPIGAFPGNHNEARTSAWLHPDATPTRARAPWWPPESRGQAGMGLELRLYPGVVAGKPEATDVPVAARAAVRGQLRDGC